MKGRTNLLQRVLGLGPSEAAPAPGDPETDVRWLLRRLEGPGPVVVALRGDRRLTVGRGPGSDLQLDEESVSFRHAILVPPAAEDGAWQVEDRRSRHGTLVDGQRLAAGARRDLADGAELRLGLRCRYRLLSRASALAATDGDGLEVDEEAVSRTVAGDWKTGEYAARTLHLPEVVVPVSVLELRCEGLEPVPLLPGQSVVIGRSVTEADLVLPHHGVSRRHAEISYRSDGVMVRDLGSTNGTFLAGQRVGAEPRLLLPWQVLSIPPFRVTLQEATRCERHEADSTPATQERGRLEHMPLADLLQEVERERRTGSLEVSWREGSGSLAFAEGLPWSASTSEGRRGPAALKKLLEQRQGTFLLRLGQAPDGPRCILQTFSTLLLALAQRREEETEERFRAVLANVVIGIVTFDGSGVVETLNAAAARIFGYEAGAVVGQPLGILFPEPFSADPLALLVPPLAAAGARERPAVRRELAGRRSDGSVFPLELSVTEFHLGERRMFATTVQDLTEQRRTEAALRRSEEALRQSQKMEAVGRLAGGVAHDFNNALTVIKGFSELLLANQAIPAGSRRAVEQIHRAAERAAAMTSQLLAFSRKQVLSPTSLHLGAAAREMEVMLRRLLGPEVELVVETRCPDEAAWALCDPAQLEQALVNLVVNARDATREGGRVLVEVDAVTLPGEAELAAGDYVALSVSDDGCGMDAATAARVFEPFFTTKPAGKGTGLGLATVYGMVKQSRGHVTCESQPGLGSRFTLFLPRAAPPIAGGASPAHPANLRGTEAILVVDDEEPVRELVRVTLAQHGYTVQEASDGAAALAALAVPGAAFALVLTDVVMPVLGGCALAERLAAGHPDLPVLLMSGYTDEAPGRLTRPRALLRKPFTSQELLLAVREALDARAERG